MTFQIAGTLRACVVGTRGSTCAHVFLLVLAPGERFLTKQQQINTLLDRRRESCWGGVTPRRRDAQRETLLLQNENVAAEWIYGQKRSRYTY